jgi:signal transduction histidine kinase
VHPIEKVVYYTITIRDTGIGMTKEEQEKVFARSFERGQKAKEVNVTGRGIGLMLTKQVFEAHGGNVQVTSEGRDKGSTFTVNLPLDEKR